MHWYRCSTKFPIAYIVVYSHYTHIYIYKGICMWEYVENQNLSGSSFITKPCIQIIITGLKKIIYNYIFKTGFLPCQIIVTVNTIVCFKMNTFDTYSKLHMIAGINILINCQI